MTDNAWRGEWRLNRPLREKEREGVKVKLGTEKMRMNDRGPGESLCSYGEYSGGGDCTRKKRGEDRFCRKEEKG